MTIIELVVIWMLVIWYVDIKTGLKNSFGGKSRVNDKMYPKCIIRITCYFYLYSSICTRLYIQSQVFDHFLKLYNMKNLVNYPQG